MPTDRCLLLAESLADGFRKFSQGVRDPSDYWFLFAVLGLLAGGAVWLFLWDLRREKTVRAESTAEALFRELCNEHRLSKTEREWLLKASFASPEGEAQPALVFVDAGLLKRTSEMAGDDAPAYRDLLRKLFGG